MSQEKVEAARRVVEDEINAGKIGARFDALFDPQVAFRDELGTLDSRMDLRAYIQTFQETFEDFRIAIEDVQDHGDTILLVINQGGQGEASGVEIEQRFTWVMTFSGDRCVRFHIYADHGEALKAAGLSE